MYGYGSRSRKVSGLRDLTIFIFMSYGTSKLS